MKTDNTPKSAFLRTLLKAVGLGLGLLALFSVVMDTYRVFRFPELKYLNSQKNERDHITKAYEVLWKPADFLILGSSRVRDIKCEAVESLGLCAPGRCYNGGMPYGNMHRILLMLKHAATFSRVKTVLVGLDFFGFNMSDAPFDANDDERYLYPGKGEACLAVINDMGRLLFSTTALELGWNTFTGSTGLKKLFEAPSAPATRQDNGGYLPGFVDVYPVAVSFYTDFSLNSHNGQASGLDEFRAMVAFCRDHRIELKLFVNPPHAAIMEALRAEGLLPAYFEWKRRMLVILAQQAAPGQPPLLLWDFSGYNEVTTERTEEPVENPAPERNYVDSFHYTSRIGRLIVERVFGLGTPGIAPEFGFVLTLNSLGQVRADLDRGHERYLREQGDYVRYMLSRKKPADAAKAVSSTNGN